MITFETHQIDGLPVQKSHKEKVVAYGFPYWSNHKLTILLPLLLTRTINEDIGLKHKSVHESNF